MNKNTTSEKLKGLFFNLLVYLGAFAISSIPFMRIENLLLSELVFTVTATVIIYIIAALIRDTSLYDPYWSVAPPVMLLIAMIKGHFWHRNGILVLLAVIAWSLRLTYNWIVTFAGLTDRSFLHYSG